MYYLSSFLFGIALLGLVFLQYCHHVHFVLLDWVI